MKKKRELTPLMARINSNYHRQFKKLSYLTGKSIAKLTEEAVIDKLNQYKNILTNADIVIS